MTKTYRSGIDAIGLTDTEKDALTARLNSSLASSDTFKELSGIIDKADMRELADDVPADSSSAHRMRRVIAATAGALVLTLVGGTAYAVTEGLVSVPDAVAGIFGQAPASTEVVEKVGRPVAASDTSDGVTITADAIVGDKNNIAVVYSIVREDGKPFNGIKADEDGMIPLMFNKGNTGIIPTLSELWRGEMSAGGGSWFYDANPDDPAIQYVEQWSYSGFDSIIGRTYTAHLEDLMLMGEGDDWMKPVVSGSWKLRFTINFEDTTREVDLGNATVTSAENKPANVTEFEFSNLAFRVVIETPGIHRARTVPVPKKDLVWNEKSGGWDVSGEAMEAAGADGIGQEEDGTWTYLFEEQKTPEVHIVLKMKDGSTVECDTDSASSSVTPDEERNLTRHEVQGFLPQIVNADDVQAVIVGGAEIPVK